MKIKDSFLRFPMFRLHENHPFPGKILCLLFLAVSVLTTAGCGSSGSGTPISGDGSLSAPGDTDTANNDEDGIDSSATDDESTDSAADDNDTDALSFQDIIAEYLPIILDYDSYGVQFDLALSAVESYLDGTLSLADTEAEIEAVCLTLTEYCRNLTDYTVSAELSRALQDHGILPEDFEYFADLRADQASEYLSDLDFLDFYLPYADDYDFDLQEVSFWFELHSTIQEAYRGYYFYGSVNYWFAEWDEEQTACVQEEVIPLLASYIPETYVWETSQTASEEKAMSYLDILEDCVAMDAEHLGGLIEELNRLKRELEDAQ
ncbi:MAG: hypothetical protein LUE29_02360 [Lachnospiraceae bacterium]|nr:hypothetical protein [Lachnospiraceae bacterium]